MQPLPVRLSVILPVLAEKESLAQLVGCLHELADEVLHEILVIVAPGSPADTREICARTAQRFPTVRMLEQDHNPGVGLALRQGIAAATGTHILLMDSDGEMDVGTVPSMLAALERTGADMVIGSRWVRGGGVEGYGRLKYVLNRGFQVIFRVLYRTSVRDLTLGFKLARAEVLKSFEWTSQFQDMGCETTVRPIRAGYRVTEVPTVWRCRTEGSSNNPLRRNFKYVKVALSVLAGS